MAEPGEGSSVHHPRRSVEGRRRSSAEMMRSEPAGCTAIDYNHETALVIKHATPYVSKRARVVPFPGVSCVVSVVSCSPLRFSPPQVRQFILRRQGCGGGFFPEVAKCSAFLLIADIRCPYCEHQRYILPKMTPEPSFDGCRPRNCIWRSYTSRLAEFLTVRDRLASLSQRVHKIDYIYD